MLEATTADMVSSCVPYKSCTLDSGVQVAWYQHLKDVPKGVSTSRTPSIISYGDTSLA